MQISSVLLNHLIRVNLIQRIVIQCHINCIYRVRSYSYYIKCFDDTIYQLEPVTYVAQNEKDDVGQRFVESLEKQIKIIYNRFLRYSKEKNNYRGRYEKVRRGYRMSYLWWNAW